MGPPTGSPKPGAIAYARRFKAIFGVLVPVALPSMALPIPKANPEGVGLSVELLLRIHRTVHRQIDSQRGLTPRMLSFSFRGLPHNQAARFNGRIRKTRRPVV